MGLEADLARELLRRHPERAAGALERLEVAQAVACLARSPAGEAAGALHRLAPHFAVAVLEALEPATAAELLAELPLGAATRLVRRLPETRRESVLQSSRERRARAVRALLRFAENTAGALMDPEVLALPEDLTAREALAQVRTAPERARYNLYVVDREHLLVGVLNLRELFLARPRAQLADLMKRAPLALAAAADRAALVSHPGWKEVHCLPVVDERGVYLGAVRYRTLRSREGDLFAPRARDASAPEALGELLAAGATGLFDALTGAAVARAPGESDGA
jgi:magnesium transporter